MLLSFLADSHLGRTSETRLFSLSPVRAAAHNATLRAQRKAFVMQGGQESISANVRSCNGLDWLTAPLTQACHQPDRFDAEEEDCIVKLLDAL